MMAAITAAGLGKSTLLLEKMNRCGKKISITGKGRCNVTNNCTSDDFFANIPTNPRFLYSAYAGFNPQDCMDFFERLGSKRREETVFFPSATRRRISSVRLNRAAKIMA